MDDSINGSDDHDVANNVDVQRGSDDLDDLIIQVCYLFGNLCQ